MAGGQAQGMRPKVGLISAGMALRNSSTLAAAGVHKGTRSGTMGLET